MIKPINKTSLIVLLYQGKPSRKLLVDSIDLKTILNNTKTTNCTKTILTPFLTMLNSTLKF